MKREALAVVMIAPLLAGPTPIRDGPTAGGSEHQQHSFRTLAEGAYSRVSQRTVAVVRDEQAWKGLAPKLGPASLRGAVDWEKDQLLVLFAGERTSGGYRVEVTRIAMEGAEAVVHVTDIEPDPSCSTTQALTYPFAVIAMPRSTRDPVARWTTRTGPRC